MVWFKSKIGVLIILVGISFLLLYSIYGKIMIEPNSYMLSDDGEAMRSYYVMTSHLQNDSSLINFEGMNYPYGEHLSYCDGQPLTTFIIKGVALFFSAIKNYSVGYMNILSLYSLILSAILIFLLLVELKMPYVYAVFIAIALMMLTPQVTRMRWQPALALSCYIPLVLYLFVKLFKNDNVKWKLILGLNTVLWYFIHPYLGLMLSVFLLVAFIVKWFYSQRTFSFRKIFLVVSITVLPAIFFMFFMKITDTHINRVESPTGLVQFSSYFDSIFLSSNSPLTPFYQAIFGYSTKDFMSHMEAWAYISFAANLFLIFLFVNCFFKKKEIIKAPEIVSIIFISSIVLLIISFAIPFKLFPKSIGLLELIPPLKQFRALGRFSWFFVYSTTIFMGYYLVLRIRESTKKLNKIAFQILFFGVMLFSAWEGYYLHKDTASESSTKNLLTINNDLPETLKQLVKSINPSDYQAIVPIPYYHIGSHTFIPNSEPPHQFITKTLLLAHRLKLPLTSSFFSRNSKTESIKSFQFFSDNMFQKKIETQFSKKPLLIYLDKSLKISEEERRIVYLGNIVFENEEAFLIKVYPEDIFKNDSNAYLTSFKVHQKDYLKRDNLYYNKGSWCKKNSFNNQDLKLAFLESPLLISDFTTVFFNQEKFCKNAPDGNYKISFWYNHNVSIEQVKLYRRVTNKQTGKIIEEINLHWGLKTFNILNDWMLCEFDFSLDSKKNTEFYFKKEPYSQINQIMIDDLMVRSAQSSIFEEIKPNKWLWNNRPLNYDTEK